VARPSGLGRGLDALIPTEVTTGTGPTLVELPVGSIEPSPRQPRVHFEEESLAMLAASIRELGVLQPVIVRSAEDGTGRYELIIGERRWRAAKRAGLATIPALVRTASDATSLEQALVENLHRADLNPLEEAAAYQQLVEDFNLTHEEIAARVGRSRVSVTNTLRLLALPASVRRHVADGELSAGHARALLGTPDRAFQESLARRAVAEGLSVRAVEEAVRTRSELAAATGTRGGAEGAPPGPRFDRGTPPPAAVAELERLLSDFLASRVKIELRPGKGRLTVEFAGLDDLERIYRLLIKQPT